MRTAAGVLLLITAILNFFAALGYLLGGAALGFGGLFSFGMQDAVRGMEAQGGAQGPETGAVMEGFGQLGSMLGLAGGGLAFVGLFFLVSVVILIAGAVFLFKATRPRFVYVACAVAVLGEVIGTLLTQPGVTNVFGLAGGGLGFIAARRMTEVAPVPVAANVEALSAPRRRIPYDRGDKVVLGIMILGLLLVAGAVALMLMGSGGASIALGRSAPADGPATSGGDRGAAAKVAISGSGTAATSRASAGSAPRSLSEAGYRSLDELAESTASLSLNGAAARLVAILGYDAAGRELGMSSSMRSTGEHGGRYEVTFEEPAASVKVLLASRVLQRSYPFVLAR